MATFLVGANIAMVPLARLQKCPVTLPLRGVPDLAGRVARLLLFVNMTSPEVSHAL